MPKNRDSSSEVFGGTGRACRRGSAEAYMTVPALAEEAIAGTVSFPRQIRAPNILSLKFGWDALMIG